jgi:hypothetical protein
MELPAFTANPNEWEPDETPPREQPGRNKMRVEDARDDATTWEWSPDNAQQVHMARTVFDERLKRGYHAFRIYENGAFTKRMTKFDEKAKEILVVGQIAWPPPSGYDSSVWIGIDNSPKPQAATDWKPYKLTESDRRFITPIERWHKDYKE